MFRALSTMPWTRPTGEIEKTKTGDEIRWHRVIGWKELGTVSSLAEAKAKWGGSPVIEPIEDFTEASLIAAARAIHVASMQKRI